MIMRYLQYAITVCVFLCRRIVRGQTIESVKVHKPDECHSRFEDWGKNGTDCPEPVFAGNPPMVHPNIITNTSSISLIILMHLKNMYFLYRHGSGWLAP